MSKRRLPLTLTGYSKSSKYRINALIKFFYNDSENSEIIQQYDIAVLMIAAVTPMIRLPQVRYNLNYKKYSLNMEIKTF